MSKFASDTVNLISPYIPGEQPKDKRYIKLNTNENPYYTSSLTREAITKELVSSLNRYSDPDSRALVCAISEYYNVDADNVLVTNGSDEALAFCFYAYGNKGLRFPDVTYGFYSVIASLFNLAVRTIPLKNDFTIDKRDYFNSGETIVIANPNAQTGIAAPDNDIVEIIENNSDNIVIVDRAYADFSESDCIPLIKEYKNLITVSTFSKSRSLAGGRVGYVIADKELIDDLKKVKNSFHPYNVNSLSAALAAQAIKDNSYFKTSVGRIIKTRENLKRDLEQLGFSCLPSSTNFILAKHRSIGGEELYLKLKTLGVLVRYFPDERIKDFIRITIGTEEEMSGFVKIVEDIIKEVQ